MIYTYIASGRAVLSGIAITSRSAIFRYTASGIAALNGAATTLQTTSFNPNLETITGAVIAAATIINVAGALSFSGRDSRGYYQYDQRLNALAGLILELIPSDNPSYDYITIGGLYVRSNWVNQVQVQVLWNLIAPNTQVQVSTDNVNWQNAYFDLYDPLDPNQQFYYVWDDGRTSYSHLNTAQVEEVTCIPALTLNSKYFTIYNGTDRQYYVWFNVAANGIDPGLVGGPFFGTHATGIQVLLLNADKATDVAIKLKVTMAGTPGFSATIKPNDSTTVAIASTTVARTYAPNAENSGLTISVVTEGNDEIGYKYARLA
jgi:hypothetical protein